MYRTHCSNTFPKLFQYRNESSTGAKVPGNDSQGWQVSALIGLNRSLNQSGRNRFLPI